MMYPEKLEVFEGKMTPYLSPAALSPDVHEPTSVTYLCPANLAPNWYIIWRGKVEGTLGNKKDGHINFKQLWCKAGENLGIEYIFRQIIHNRKGSKVATLCAMSRGFHSVLPMGLR